MTTRTDAFTRSDSSSALGTPTDSGAAWVAGIGTWGISSNRGYNVDGAAAHAIAYLESSIADVDVQVTLPVLGGASTAFGLCFRVTDASNYLYLQFWTGDNGWSLYKVVSGSETLLANITGTCTAGDVLLIQTNGNNIVFKQNGTTVLSTTESFGNTATKHGLHTYATTAARFDDFSITATTLLLPIVSKSGSQYADVNTAWVGDVLPVDGTDTIEIAAGSTITVRDQQDWGLNTALPTSSFDVIIQNTGKIVIASGGVLTLHGNVDVKSHNTAGTGFTPYIDIEDGGKLEFYDGYYIRAGDTLWQYRYIKGRGAFEISTRVGASANGYFVNVVGGQGLSRDFQGQGSLFKLLRLGSASQAVWGTGTGPGGILYICEDGYADGCGLFEGAGNCADTDTLRYKNFSTFNTSSTYSMRVAIPSVPTSGQALFENVAFDKGFHASGVNITGVTFNNVSTNLPFPIGSAVAAADIFISPEASGNSYSPVAATTTRLILVIRSGGSNEKDINFSTGSSNPFTFDDTIIVKLGATSTDGEYVAATGVLGNGRVAVFNRPIFLPYKDGTAPHICEVATDATSRIDFIHGTMAASSYGLGLGHSGHNVSTADRYRLKSSIVYNFSSEIVADKISWITNDIEDCVDPVQADYNCGWGLTQQLQASRYSNPAVGYQQKQTDTSTLPGVHDIDVDPWLGRTDVSDFMRILAKWAGTLGMTGTDAQKETKALNAIHARLVPTHADYVAGATGVAFGEYVREQMAVSNSLLNNAGHDGVTIGAMGYVALGGAGGTGSARCSRLLRP